MPDNASIAVVAVGSNKPFLANDLTETVSAAMQHIELRVGVIRARSRFFRTPAFPTGSGPDFVNAVFLLETSLNAYDLLQALHAVEAAFGRDRRKRWAQRTLDLDLIAIDDLVLPDRNAFEHWANLPLEKQIAHAPEGLILPHPRLHERAFVLIPFMDVVPDWVHPVHGRTVAQMCADLPDAAREEVVAL
ncbi:MAG: 2-amino-4-hydroxy-6-hydroxymethyldihydropteridine diphosphokinase [Pseudomonadota bacterium]